MPKHFPGINPLSSKVFADVSFGDVMVQLMQIISKSTMTSGIVATFASIP